MNVVDFKFSPFTFGFGIKELRDEPKLIQTEDEDEENTLDLILLNGVEVMLPFLVVTIAGITLLDPE